MNSNLAGFRPARGIASIGVSELLRIVAAATKLMHEGRPAIVLGAGETGPARRAPCPATF